MKVKNAGALAGDEVVQLYLSRQDAPANAGLPLRALRGFQRVNLKPGEEKTIVFQLTPFQFTFVNRDGVRTVEPGEYRIGIGGGQRAAVSAIARIAARIVDPPYAHNHATVK